MFERKFLKFCSVEGLWTKMFIPSFIKINVLYVFLSLKIFQFCSVGPTGVGLSEHTIGTDGTISYNKY